MFQSEAEIKHVAEEWVVQFQPTVAPRLVITGAEGEQNMTRIMERCAEKGYASISNLTASYEELAAARMLYLYQEPKKLTAAEIAQKEQDKMREDYLKSIRPQESFEDKVKADKAKQLAEKKAKAQLDAEQTLALLIGTGVKDAPLGSYVINLKSGPGIDLFTSEAIQRDLRTISWRNAAGKKDFILTLKVVREILGELGDYPTPSSETYEGDVVRTLNRINARRSTSESREDQEAAAWAKRPR
jgi:uncharacterized protein YnzC (UPF0291/DUF896 family)